MKKWISFLLAMFLLAGCQIKQTEDNKALNILAPSGAPSLGLVEYIDEFTDTCVTIAEGTDALSAAFLSPDSEYDVIVAPLNLGATMITKGSMYQLKGILTWGNLYLVENKDLMDSDKELALFGEQAVPGKVIKSVMDLDSLDRECRWYSAVSEVSAALLAGDCAIGLLAEPVLTATLAKAKKLEMNLEVSADMQKLFGEKYETESYPQAAVFVHKKALDEKSEDVAYLVEKLQAVNVESMKKIEGKESFYGTPAYAVIEKAFDNMAISYKEAKEAKKEISAFLALFGMENTDALFVE